jgi:hypothetical protein
MWLVYSVCWVVGSVGLYTFLVRTSREIDPNANFDNSSMDIDLLQTPFYAEEPEEYQKAA